MKDYLEHIMAHQKKYLGLFSFVVLLIPLLINFTKSKPVLGGVETYYHLVGFEFTPWRFANYISSDLLIFLPMLLGILTVLLFLKIAKLIKLDQKIAVIYLILVISSAGFIFAYSTISSYALYSFFVACGFWLALQKRYKIFSLVPFTLASLFDAYSSLLLLALIAIFIGTKLKNIFHWILFTLVSVLTGINFLTDKFILGPFVEQSATSSLISDLGSISGVSFFVVLLALIGVTVTWQRRKLYTSYGLAVAVGVVYFIFPQTILLMTMITCFFAAVAAVYLYDRFWNLSKLRDYTFLLIILGLVFSNLSYLNRVSEGGPTFDDHNAMLWMKDNVEGVIFSDPDNSYVIRYITGKSVVDYPHLKLDIQKNGLQELYVRQLFPILEEQSVDIIFVSEDMRNDLSAEQGLLFLLRNERFKLVHSSGNAEVWSFT